MTQQAAPRSYWIVSTVLLLWSLAGVGAFASQVSMAPQQLAQLAEAQRNAFAAMPDWIWTAYGIATVGALAAAICLLLRRSWATPLYAISLVAVLAQFGWTFVGYRLLDSMPAAEAAPFPAFIIVMALISLLYARHAGAKGWLA